MYPCPEGLYEIFKADVDSVSNSHDVYLKFLGTGTGQLFRINLFKFLSEPCTNFINIF
jgi:hypothetical protein